jgi:type VI secretion system protein ImpH
VDRARFEAVLDRLNVEPWAHDFFALVRRMEAIQHTQPGFGVSNRASEDPVRFAQEPLMAFPPCTVSQFHFARSNAPARLFVNFMGLLGPMGPLPLHLTEYAYHRERHHKDRTLSRFLDIFNHRMISLFYRAWAASQMPASYDRCAPPVWSDTLTDLERQQILALDRDRYAVYVGATCGLGMDEVRHRDALPDAAKLHFAGRLAAATHGPEGLAAVLSSYFKVDATVEEFAGRWVELPAHNLCRLGDRTPATSLGTMSGGGAVCGSRTWECQGAFRARLGPMRLKDYQRLLPHASSARRITSWIRNYLGDEFAWEVLLILKADEVPRTRLGEGARLGWTSWVLSGACPEDRCDLALRSAH